MGVLRLLACGVDVYIQTVYYFNSGSGYDNGRETAVQEVNTIGKQTEAARFQENDRPRDS